MGDPAPQATGDNGPPPPAPLQPGMLTWWRGTGAWHVRCAHCHTELVHGTDLVDTLTHAQRFAEAKPCCAAWSTTTRTNPPTATPTKNENDKSPSSGSSD